MVRVLVEGVTQGRLPGVGRGNMAVAGSRRGPRSQALVVGVGRGGRWSTERLRQCWRLLYLRP